MRGGERVLEVLCERFPQADLYTLFHDRGSVSPRIENRQIFTSRLQKMPLLRNRYRSLLPLFPWAASDLSRQLRNRKNHYDLIVSTSHCVAKGVKGDDLPHFCYCHTPMRYVWDRFDDYFGPGRPALHRYAGAAFRNNLQTWDRNSNTHVHRFVANSRYVRKRIRRFYGRDAQVIYPPVDCHRFSLASKERDEELPFYLMVSALVPYKRVDLAVEAAERSGRRLIVVGRGPEQRKLESIAAHHVEFRGWCSDDEVASLLSRCEALLFPGEEDFGITPLEAMASGRPVIALGRGGALETVRCVSDVATTPTGVLFNDASVEALIDAMDRYEKNSAAFNPKELRRHAEQFDTERFRRELIAEIESFARLYLF